MAAMTKIEWTDATWNPVTGCSAVSEGCRHCYAATMTRRLEGMGQAKYDGLVNDTHFNGTVRCHDDALTIPIKRKKPTTWFVNSMSDLFHEGVPFEFVDKVFAVMAICPQHTFQVLTKRPERMAEYLDDLSLRRKLWAALIESYWNAASVAWALRDHHPQGLPNVWLGTSCEDQATADKRIHHLRRCPAAVRFLSCEPLLGPIELQSPGPYRQSTPERIQRGLLQKICAMNRRDVISPGIDWVIVGGESGPGARLMDPDWVRSIRDQCVAAGVPFFFKQWGGVNKKAAGRVLDGRTWDEMP